MAVNGRRDGLEVLGTCRSRSSNAYIGETHIDQAPPGCKVGRRGQEEEEAGWRTV